LHRSNLPQIPKIDQWHRGFDGLLSKNFSQNDGVFRLKTAISEKMVFFGIIWFDRFPMIVIMKGVRQ
jgi:hypothetical protein